jgi:hypothetical protein
MFTIGGWQGEEIAKSRKADVLCEPGMQPAQMPLPDPAIFQLFSHLKTMTPKI